MDFGIANVAAITVICYLIGMMAKNISLDKWIPCIVGLAGMCLGMAAFIFKVPDFPANDLLTAAAVGVVSGLAATGFNQMYKQAGKLE